MLGDSDNPYLTTTGFSVALRVTRYFTGALAVLMLSMGITLSPKDFVNVLKRPNAVMLGFVFCYIMMPALAYALGIGAGLSPALLAGLVLVGCINGGQASNLCTFIANGNVSILGCCWCLVGQGLPGFWCEALDMRRTSLPSACASLLVRYT